MLLGLKVRVTRYDFTFTMKLAFKITVRRCGASYSAAAGKLGFLIIVAPASCSTWSDSSNAETIGFVVLLKKIEIMFWGTPRRTPARPDRDTRFNVVREGPIVRD